MSGKDPIIHMFLCKLTDFLRPHFKIRSSFRNSLAILFTRHKYTFLFILHHKLEIVDLAMETDFGARGIKSAVWEEFLSSDEEWVIQEEQAFPEVDFDTFIKKYQQANLSA